MSIIGHLIVDRTQNDVEEIKRLQSIKIENMTPSEKETWLTGKGAYNARDLNRVTEAMEYLYKALTKLGYVVDYEEVVIPHDNDIPAAEQINNNTLVMIHGNALSDSGPQNLPVTNHGATVAQIDGQFNSGSLYFDGTGFLTLPALNLQNTDFTIDWREYLPTGKQGARFYTAYVPNQNLATGILCNYGFDGLSYVGSVSAVESTSIWDIFRSVPMTDSLYGQWVHRAIVRQGNTWSAYSNGTLIWSGTSSGQPYYSPDVETALGIYTEIDAASNFEGYIEEFRVSNTAIWTGNFTPPSGPYQQYKYDNRWYPEDIPTESQMSQFLRNLAAIKSAISVLSTTPDAPSSMAFFNYVGANNIEKILLDVDFLIENMRRSWYYSGEIYSGEV